MNCIKRQSTIVAIIIIYCSCSIAQVQDNSSNTLSLVLSFGDVGIDDKYLLVQPLNIAVNDFGDIYIADENRIKVFDSFGKPKQIIGSLGQGPGEFEIVRNITIGSSNQIIVISGPSGNHYSVFSRNHEFLYRRDLNLLSDFQDYKTSNNFNLFMLLGNSYNMSASENILNLIATKYTRKESKGFEILALEKDESLTIIKEYESVSSMGGIIFFKLGRLIVTNVSDRTIIYCNGGIDREIVNNKGVYTLNVHSLDSGISESISHEYTLIDISEDEEIKNELKKLEAKVNMPMGITEAGLELVHKSLDELKYLSPIQNLFYDNGLLFVITFQKNDSGQFLTDIFDVKSKKYLKSIYLPTLNRIFSRTTIKNGYLYRIKSSPDEFTVAEKYKIAPNVYLRK